MTISFTGDFSKLIEEGFSVSELYATDIVTYHKDDIWIFKERREVDIEDFYGFSSTVLAHLIEHNFTFPNPYNRLTLNRETNKVEEFNAKRHEGFYHYETLSEEEMDKFFKRYKVHSFEDETLDTLKKLYEQNTLTIVHTNDAE